MVLSKTRISLVLISASVFVLLLLNYLDQPRYVQLLNDPIAFNVDHGPQRLLNISYQYILNNDSVCYNTSDDILAVFIVTSYFGNVEVRSSMRRAFSIEDLKKRKLRRVFLLGVAPTDTYTKQNAIENESQRFGDIIQGNFTEAYRNLTYKHVMGLKWATKFCSNSKFIIKMDDDIVINMYKLNEIFYSIEKLSHKKFIAGYVLRNMLPIREPANKWYVTIAEYPYSTYPSFVSGWLYITNIEAAKNIVALSDYEKYFWIDDLFVTGILAKKLKLVLYDISQHFSPHSEYLQCCLQYFDNNFYCDINIGPNGGDNNMFYSFNAKAHTCFISKKCKKIIKSLNKTCVAERKVNLGRGIGNINRLKLK